MLELSVVVLVLIADQLTKYFTDLYLPLGTSVPLIDGLIHLTAVHNTGAAWGMLSGARVAFLILTPILCAALILLLVKRRSRIGVLGRVCIALLLSGAIGNLIDRALLGYVRDMFEFSFFTFPVFNVADMSITFGCVLLCIDTLFLKRGTLFGALEREKPRQSDPGADGEEAQGDV